MIQPYSWQQASVDELTEILKTQPFALNCSETGTGKTIVALQSLKNLSRKTLVICPKAVHSAWSRTAAAMECSELIYGIINPEKLQYKNPYVSGLQWLIPKDVTITWDEIHRGASGAKSQTTKILAATKPQGISVLAMSATIASSPLQMRAIGYLAGLHQFRTASFFEWCRDNGCFRAAYANNALVFPKGPKGRAIMQEIGERLRPMMTRIRIADVPEFPETRIVANLYDLPESDIAEINKVCVEMRKTIKDTPFKEFTIRLYVREQIELKKVSLLTDLINEAIEEDKSAVVFVNFRSTLAQLLANCSQHKHTVDVIHGDQKPAERQMAIDGFQEDKIQVLVCMTQAGGVGINLQGVAGRRERASFITPSDSSSDFVQCLGRIHRATGGPTVQTIVLAAGTVEEKIHANLQGKLDNLKSLNDGVLSDEDLKL